MRSGVGSFWPRSRRLDFLEDFLPCELLCAAEPVGFFAAGLCAFTEMENTPSPAARSSDEAKCVAFRRFRRIACRSYCWFSAGTFPDRYTVAIRSLSWRRRILKTISSPAFKLDTALR